MKRRRLNDREKVDIINSYTVDLIPMAELAERYGVTRQAIFKMIRKAGIDTSKEAAHMNVSCSCCGEITTRIRCQVRKSKHIFCSEECYFAWLKHGNGNPLVMHRQSSRIARKIVQEYFALAPTHTVHHEDRNQYNNNINNLKVFTCQGDHVRYHRGFTVPILFDGSTIKTPQVLAKGLTR